MLSILKEKSFYRKILALAVPISLQSLITFGVNLMDTVMVGKFGEIALSATSLGGSFFMIYSTICMGIGCGAGVITSQYWGAGELEPIKDMTSICLKITTAIGLLFTVLSLLFPQTILKIYTSDPEVIVLGAKYLQVIAATFVLAGLSTAGTQILRSVGQVRVSLYASIGAFIVNVFFNWVFIFGKLGMPRLEVVGAAIGTSIARLFEFCFICGYLFFKDKIIGFRFADLKGFNRIIFAKYIKAGLPVLCSDLLMSLGSQLTTIIIGHVGSDFTAAISIANVVNNCAFCLFFGVSNASLVMTGNTIGEGRFQDAYREALGYLVIAFGFGIVAGLMIFVVKGPIIGIYEVTESTKLITNQVLVVMSCIMPFMLMDHVFTKGVLRGGGDTKFLVVADTVFTYILSAPLGYLAAFVLHWPCWAVFAMLKTDLVGKMVMCCTRFFSKKWIKDVTVQGSDVAKVELPAE